MLAQALRQPRSRQIVETFVQNYPEGHWRARERQRFISAIERIEREHENR